MKNLEGRVAVITGGASGIGFGLAERAAREGMRVVIADVEPGALSAAVEKLRAGGAEVLGVRTDVRRYEQVEALRDQTLKAFGNVHLLCNNAGVSVAGMTWDLTADDWDWTIGVNLYGVVHGIRAFVPAMIAAGDEGHIVNTASMAGLIASPGSSAYSATKHAVVAISESLFHEFNMTAARLRCSVLCPGWVNTNIADSDRNRPADLPNVAVDLKSEAFAAISATVRQLLATGMSTADVAGHVFGAIREERFWILTHPEFKSFVTERFEGAVAGTNPTTRTL